MPLVPLFPVAVHVSLTFRAPSPTAARSVTGVGGITSAIPTPTVAGGDEVESPSLTRERAV